MTLSKLARKLKSQNVVEKNSVFDLDKEIKSDYKTVLSKAMKTFKLIGSGCTRAVFDYDKDYVLKVALSTSGCNANKSECQLANKLKLITPKIIMHSSNYSFILQTKCQQFDKVNISKLAGINYLAFRCVVDYAIRQSLTSKYRVMLNDDTSSKPKVNIAKEAQLVDKIRKTNKLIDNFIADFVSDAKSIRLCDLVKISPDIIGRTKNFGLADGKIKMLDAVICSDSYIKMRSRSKTILSKLKNISKDQLMQSIKMRKYGQH